MCKMTFSHQKFCVQQESAIKLQFLYVPGFLFFLFQEKKRGGGTSTYFVSLVCPEILLSEGRCKPSANLLHEQSLGREPCPSLLQFQLRAAAHLFFCISYWCSLSSNSWILSCGKTAHVFADLSWELSCLIPLTAMVTQQRTGR